MKKLIVLIVLTILFVVACSSPPEIVVETVIVEVTAKPTATTVSTATTEPTATVEPTATLTPSPTPDVRVIDIDPRKMVMPREILPAEGKYYLVHETPHRNSEILSTWGTDKGREYLEATGRVDGWVVVYVRGTATVRMPEYVHANAVLYRTAEGADRKDVLDRDADNPCSDQGEDYVLVKDNLDLGTSSHLCLWKEMQSNGKYYVVYHVKFIYRNVGIQMWAEDYEDRFDMEWVIDLAERQFDHLLTLPLSSSVIFQP